MYHQTHRINQIHQIYYHIYHQINHQIYKLSSKISSNTSNIPSTSDKSAYLSSNAYHLILFDQAV